MGKSLLIGAVMLGAITAFLSVVCLTSVALAAGNQHIAEALDHAKEAVAHGKQGHADVLVKHAQEGLKHAEAAQKDMKNPHLAEGVMGLPEAATQQKAGLPDTRTSD